MSSARSPPIPSGSGPANVSVTVDQSAPGGAFPAVGTTVDPDRTCAARSRYANRDGRDQPRRQVKTSPTRPRSRRSLPRPTTRLDATATAPTLGAVITDRAGDATTLTQPSSVTNASGRNARRPGPVGPRHDPALRHRERSRLGHRYGRDHDRAVDRRRRFVDPIASPATWTPADGMYELRAVVPDKVGNSTTTATRTILVDNTAPTVSNNADANWHNAAVTVALTGVDAESGVALRAASSPRSTEARSRRAPRSSSRRLRTARTTGTPITYHATNRARVTSADKTAAVKIDATAPNNVTLDSPAAATAPAAAPSRSPPRRRTRPRASPRPPTASSRARSPPVRARRAARDHVSLRHDDGRRRPLRPLGRSGRCSRRRHCSVTRTTS